MTKVEIRPALGLNGAIDFFDDLVADEAVSVRVGDLEFCLEHDLSEKPLSTPDRVEGKLFRIML